MSLFSQVTHSSSYVYQDTLHHHYAHYSYLYHDFLSYYRRPHCQDYRSSDDFSSILCSPSPYLGSQVYPLHQKQTPLITKVLGYIGTRPQHPSLKNRWRRQTPSGTYRITRGKYDQETPQPSSSSLPSRPLDLTMYYLLFPKS